ncbi:MAG: hypothetical protein EPN70_16955 [Paraburkholderia sp.]|uniref:hypothetical protein n=1 Tax=Paraburkholderia sp. TaxID=1926495 RepID=UPI0011FDDE8C|nr:hypothetical protein [Paraburkholderia sp.]TAM02364.1 MAG: hypothetical protein EPN70_16955 [Paraburkholderia sp.]TAM27433.1 MAG: hypothetical protein EPN59_19485 [Paraburkholderia sp.]
MGWPGIVVIGVVVGAAGWWLHPMRARAHGCFALAVMAGVLGAGFARVAGRVTGLFHDGELLEWPVCTASALVFVAVAVALRVRR